MDQRVMDADGSGCVWRRFEDLWVAYTGILIYVCILIIKGLQEYNHNISALYCIMICNISDLFMTATYGQVYI